MRIICNANYFMCACIYLNLIDEEQRRSLKIERAEQTNLTFCRRFGAFKAIIAHWNNNESRALIKV